VTSVGLLFCGLLLRIMCRFVSLLVLRCLWSVISSVF